MYPELLGGVVDAGAPLAEPDLIARAIEARYPGGRFEALDYPTSRRPAFLAGVTWGGARHAAVVHATSARVLGELPPADGLQKVRDLHSTLWADSAGVAVNGFMAVVVWVLCAAAVLGRWPGVGARSPAFSHDRSRRAVASALGTPVLAVCLLGLAMWAGTGVCLAFPWEMGRIVRVFAPLGDHPQLRSGPPVADADPPTVHALVDQALARYPGTHVVRVNLAQRTGDVYGVVLARGTRDDGSGRGEMSVWFDQFSGAWLRTDPLDATAADVFLSWLARLHLGTCGGVAIRVIWAGLGVAAPVLFAVAFARWHRGLTIERGA